MKRTLMILTFILMTVTVFAQTPVRKKVEGLISHEYVVKVSPLTIKYKAHQYSGSGNYKYRWRVRGQKFEDTYSTNNSFEISYNCDSSINQRCAIYCEVLDTVTGKTYFLDKDHVVEYCN